MRWLRAAMGLSIHAWAQPPPSAFTESHFSRLGWSMPMIAATFRFFSSKLSRQTTYISYWRRPYARHDYRFEARFRCRFYFSIFSSIFQLPLAANTNFTIIFMLDRLHAEMTPSAHHASLPSPCHSSSFLEGAVSPPLSFIVWQNAAIPLDD